MKVDPALIEYLKTIFVSRKHNTVITGTSKPGADNVQAVGSDRRRFSELHVKKLYADQIVGRAVNGLYRISGSLGIGVTPEHGWGLDVEKAFNDVVLAKFGGQSEDRPAIYINTLYVGTSRVISLSFNCYWDDTVPCWRYGKNSNNKYAAVLQLNTNGYLTGYVSKLPGSDGERVSFGAVPHLNMTGLTGDVTSQGWTDYSSSSTVIGWSSYTTKSIEYKRVGNLIFVSFNINGTSDSTAASFTVPQPCKMLASGVPIKGIDSGSPTTAYISQTVGSRTVNAYPTYTYLSSWTASGDKQITGRFWYEIIPWTFIGFTNGATGIGTAEAFGTPSINSTQGVSPTGISSAEAFGTPRFNYIWLMSGISSIEAFGTPYLVGSDQDVELTSGIASGQAFGVPQVVSPGEALYLTGFEHNTMAAQPNYLFNSITGTVNIQSTAPHGGTYHMQAVSTGTMSYVYKSWLSGNPYDWAARVYIRFVGSVPSANCKLFSFDTDQATEIYLRYDVSKNKFTVKHSGTASEITLSGTPVADTWYRFDLGVDANTSTHYVYAAKDGTKAFMSVSGQTTEYLYGLRYGIYSNITATAYFDDIIITKDVDDYPIGPGEIELLRPDGAGTSNPGSGVIQDNASVDVDDSTNPANVELDELPLSESATYIKQVSNDNAKYAEVTMDDITGEPKWVNGVSGLLHVSQLYVGSANGACYAVRADSTQLEIWGLPGSLAETYSQGSVYISAILAGKFGGGWTEAEVNALKARVGHSTSTSSVPVWRNVMIEVDYRT